MLWYCMLYAVVVSEFHAISCVGELLQEAVKFMRHGKRQKLNTADVNSALQMKNMEVGPERTNAQHGEMIE